jgi:hypothetical protein
LGYSFVEGELETKIEASIVSIFTWKVEIQYAQPKHILERLNGSLELAIDLGMLCRAKVQLCDTISPKTSM